MDMKKNIALLYGGISSERDISLLSGKSVGEALARNGHHVTYIDPKIATDMEKLRNQKFDIAYIALHGKGGEDGKIQQVLENLNIPYTGSKVKASSIAINKARTKEYYDQANIPNAKWKDIKNYESVEINDVVLTTGDDVVVKAASEGSSIGLYFAKGNKEIKDAIKKAFEFDEEVVVEKRIPGREYTCAVLEFTEEDKKDINNKVYFKNNIGALPVIEIIPKNEYYDFQSKYDKGGSTHICPADLDSLIFKQIQEYAIQAHLCLGCTGFSRTDFRVSNDNKIFALETNTIPGMTSTSLVPDAAKVVGISFDDLCEKIINFELK